MDWFEGTEDEVLISWNDSGTMDETVFSRYMKGVVVPYIESVDVLEVDKKVTLPNLCD